jgi:hypothetical protein
MGVIVPLILNLVWRCFSGGTEENSKLPSQNLCHILNVVPCSMKLVFVASYGRAVFLSA